MNAQGGAQSIVSYNNEAGDGASAFRGVVFPNSSEGNYQRRQIGNVTQSENDFPVMPCHRAASVIIVVIGDTTG
jgi:hypothetical protein